MGCGDSRFSFRNGWSGVPGVQLLAPLSSCGCNEFPAQPCGPFFPPDCGCPTKLGTSCVIYNNDNQQSGLINMQLPNGSTTTQIFNVIDGLLGNINVSLWVLPFLRSLYSPLTTLPQFGNAVDTELRVIYNGLAAVSGAALVGNVGGNTDSVDVICSGTLGKNITANVNISAASGNSLVINPDGLYATPQLLTVNYATKTLGITNGNTVDLTSLVCGVSGFLGDVTVDPTAIDGQYWYNTTSAQLKIKLNGAVRVITIT